LHHLKLCGHGTLRQHTIFAYWCDRVCILMWQSSHYKKKVIQRLIFSYQMKWLLIVIKIVTKLNFGRDGNQQGVENPTWNGLLCWPKNFIEYDFGIHVAEMKDHKHKTYGLLCWSKNSIEYDFCIHVVEMNKTSHEVIFL